VIGGGFFLFTLAETVSPLRRSREPWPRRMFRNLTMAGIGLATIELLQIPILVPISHWTMDRGFGVLNLLGARGWVRAAAALLLLDYTLWHWHRINHQVSFFWRFHSVHHVDRDMDASTALRFHFGELAMSVAVRALQIVVIGADPLSVWIYQTLLFGSILFHHSNTRLPLRFERVLVRVIVTPRMHGIHHSDYRNETDTNWSSLLSIWDFLHRTLRLNVPQASITIGVPAFDAPGKVTLGKILWMPFARRRGDWDRADGSFSIRPQPEEGRETLSP
jgi:sterol desaturase/sphingolipid hydroxylase (fatty acid hydroxylase superfamily)